MAEHAFKTIGKDIKERNLKPAVLIYGKEQYLVNWACTLLKDSFINPATKEIDFTFFDASVCSSEEVISACETLAMLSEKRVVHLKVPGTVCKINEKELSDYLDQVPSETLLILSFETEEKGKELLKSALHNPNVTSYEFGTLDESTLKAFIGKRLKANGKNINTVALREFINTTGYFSKESDYTLYNLVNDVEKLCAYTQYDEISKEDVEEVTGQSVEKNVFALIDAVSRRKKGDAIKMMDDLLISGESFFGIYSILIGQIEIMYSAKQLKSRGMNYIEISKTIRAHEYRVKKALGVADRYSEEKLKKMLIDVYEIENQIKTGLLSESLAMELYIASM